MANSIAGLEGLYEEVDRRVEAVSTQFQVFRDEVMEHLHCQEELIRGQGAILERLQHHLLPPPTPPEE